MEVPICRGPSISSKSLFAVSYSSPAAACLQLHRSDLENTIKREAQVCEHLIYCTDILYAKLQGGGKLNSNEFAETVQQPYRISRDVLVAGSGRDFDGAACRDTDRNTKIQKEMKVEIDK